MTMLEIIGNVLIGLSAVVAVGLLVLLYVAWRDRRRNEDATAFIAPVDGIQEPQRGGGGPKPQLPK